MPPAIIAIAHAKTAVAPRPRKSVIVEEGDDFILVATDRRPYDGDDEVISLSKAAEKP